MIPPFFDLGQEPLAESPAALRSKLFEIQICDLSRIGLFAALSAPTYLCHRAMLTEDIAPSPGCLQYCLAQDDAKRDSRAHFTADKTGKGPRLEWNAAAIAEGELKLNVRVPRIGH
ncbi:MAG: hypothetical protein IH606_11775 [Burkholderiales bacterium]|nr:hypothetical protein [Burkholderiales bacterium]